uniref:Mediator complex subunit 9 n=2 Tax=Strongyloides papillosus TaxID=174720 RepID=A0A0N5CIB0_STREA
MEAQKANIKSIFKKLSDYTRRLFGVVIEEIPEDDKDENMEVEEKKMEFSNKGGESIDFDMAMECLNAILSNVRTLKKKAGEFSEKTQCVKKYASKCLSISKEIKVLNDKTQQHCANFEPRLKSVRKKLVDVKMKTGEEI